MPSDVAVISVRALAKVIGNLMATLEGVDAARITVMGLQTLKVCLTQQPAWDWDTQVATTAIPAELLGQAVEASCNEWTDGYNPEKPQAIS